MSMLSSCMSPWHSIANLLACAITARAVVSVAPTIIIIVVVAALNSKDRGQGDDQGKGSHDVVDDSGNIAANSNSMEGLGSVPLFNRARVT